MAEEIPVVLVMFGGSGDLAQRKLYPALFGLYKRGILGKHFAVIGTARRPWTDAHYRQVVESSVSAEGDADAARAHAFATHFYYQSHDVTDSAHYLTLKELAAKLDEQYAAGHNRLFYLAMAPHFFETIAAHLKSEQLLTADGFNRLVIEKPFGHDYESALQLNESLTATFSSDQIYRIDHYLGKEMTQALLGLRFGNGLLRRIWNKDFIKNIQITLAEAVGVEERAGYYETSGALRDMIQNHALQLFSYLTMDEPASLTADAVHAVKQQAFERLVPLTKDKVKECFVRAQYAAAQVEQVKVNGYREEEGVSKESMTETYVAGRLETSSPALSGVPIYVRTGKRMTRKSTQISVVFKKETSALFGEQAENVLTINIEPNQGYTLQINGKTLDSVGKIAPEELAFRHSAKSIAQSPEAYERLIGDALLGDQTNFSLWPELAATWRYVDTVLSGWQEDDTMPTYPAGSMGPVEADELLSSNGDSWHWQPTRIQLAD